MTSPIPEAPETPEVNASGSGVIAIEAIRLEKSFGNAAVLRGLDMTVRDGEVVAIDAGPTITLYEVQLSPGTKVAAINGVASDLFHPGRSRAHRWHSFNRFRCASALVIMRAGCPPRRSQCAWAW